MANLPESLREKLKENFDLHVFKIIRKQESKDGTKKYLFDILDNNAIESVLMNINTERQYVFHHKLGVKWDVSFVPQQVWNLQEA